MLIPGIIIQQNIVVQIIIVLKIKKNVRIIKMNMLMILEYSLMILQIVLIVIVYVYP